MNVDRIKLINLASETSLEMSQDANAEFILENVYWSEILATHATIKYVAQVGETPMNTSVGTRTVTVIGWVTNTLISTVSDFKNYLNSFVVPTEEIELFYGDKKIKFLPSSTIKYSKVKQENNEEMCKFMIEGIAFNPLFEDENEKLVDISHTRGGFMFPFIISVDSEAGGAVMGTREPSLIANILSRSQIEVGMIINMTAKGSLSNPVLYKLGNGDDVWKLEIITDMVAGQTIAIDTSTGNKSIVSTIDNVSENYIRLKTLDSTWLRLSPGNNLFRYDAEAGIENLDISVKYNNFYYEVEK